MDCPIEGEEEEFNSYNKKENGRVVDKYKNKIVKHICCENNKFNW